MDFKTFTAEEKANHYRYPNSSANVSWAGQYKNAYLHTQIGTA